MVPVMWAVVHEYELRRRTFHDFASALHETREAVENHLAYCRGRQERGEPGTEGRYYIVRVEEEEGPGRMPRQAAFPSASTTPRREDA